MNRNIHQKKETKERMEMFVLLTKKNKRNEANFDSYVGDFTEVDTPEIGFKCI
ncbi:hypothetical protein YC2023_089436 [Brassica napus]